ncbi:MAG: single-stranded DNA-binding protein [Treponema sp.]|nr:single-stranded DNA-binding protein [Treponema sp.]
MADLNRVTLVGRLTRDAELKSIASGTSVCKFSVAVNRNVKSGDEWKEEVSYFDVVLWGRRGEAVHQYMTKGKMIGVDGELRQDRWQQDGQNRSKVEIVANNIQFLGGNPGASGGQGGGGYSAPQSQGQSWQPQGGSGPAEDSFADDIPF